MWSEHGVALPEGTRLRFVYARGIYLHVYDATIKDRFIVYRRGRHRTLHDAAKAMLGHESFPPAWHCFSAKRPDDTFWTPMPWFLAGLTGDDE